METDSAVCLPKLTGKQKQKVVLLNNVVQSNPTVLPYHNSDRQEETLNGERISHHVNQIGKLCKYKEWILNQLEQNLT